MRGEDGRGTHLSDRVGLVGPVLDESGDPFDCGEGGVAFVQVMDGRSFIHRLERHRAAYPEEHLLPHPEIGFALVETFRESTIRRPVLGEVRV